MKFNSFEFKFVLLLDWLPYNALKPRLPYNLPVSGGRIVGCIPFSMILTQCKMQTASFSIWTRIVVFIFYHGKHYITSANIVCVYVNYVRKRTKTKQATPERQLYDIFLLFHFTPHLVPCFVWFFFSSFLNLFFFCLFVFLCLPICFCCRLENSDFT